jgi:hypothetical protein
MLKWLLQLFWIRPPARPEPRTSLVHLRTGIVVPKNPRESKEFTERALNEFLKGTDILEQYCEWNARYTARAYNLCVILLILAVIEFGPKYLGKFGHAIGEIVAETAATPASAATDISNSSSATYVSPDATTTAAAP